MTLFFVYIEQILDVIYDARGDPLCFGNSLLRFPSFEHDCPQLVWPHESVDGQTAWLRRNYVRMAFRGFLNLQ